MKVGDLVKMDFEDNSSWTHGDVWGPGIILCIELDEYGGHHNVEILWSVDGIGWEQSDLLDIVNGSE